MNNDVINYPRRRKIDTICENNIIILKISDCLYQDSFYLHNLYTLCRKI